MLATLVALVWIWFYGKTSMTAWQEPVVYSGDALETLARIKAAAEGDWLPFWSNVIQNLGEPWGANWNTYAEADKPLFALLGWLSRYLGLSLTANLALLFAHLGAAFAFYGGARILRVRGEWALAGAVLYACSNYTFYRGLPHFGLALNWTVPLALVTTWLVAGSHVLLRRYRWLGFGTAAALGMGSPYYLFAYLQLMVLALLWQVLGERRRANLLQGAISIGVALGVFAVLNLPQALARSRDKQLDPIVRDYRGTETYALKPLEMFVPPRDHRADALAMYGRRYDRWSFGRIEDRSSYLGLAGITSLVLLVGVTLHRVALRSGARLPAPFWQLLWILCFASIGGLGNAMAFFLRLQAFRATNRFSIFILALALLFAALWASRALRGRQRWVSGLAAAGVLLVGLWDQVPRPLSGAPRAQIAARARDDQEMGRWLKKYLPDRARVFQLPVIGFPEVIPPGTMRDYEHFRPYLATSGLGFSYGALKNRARGRWQRDVAQLPVPEFVRALEAAGFTALYINKKGMGDGAQDLLRKLAEAGYTPAFQDQEQVQTIVLLRSAEQLSAPLARRPTFGRGWVLKPQHPEWPRRAEGSAWLAYFNPLDRPLRVELVLQLSGTAAMEVWLNGQKLTRTMAGGAQKVTLGSNLDLSPGTNQIELLPADPAPGDSPTGFTLHRLDWKIEMPP